MLDKESVLAFFLGAALGAIGAAVWTGKRFEKAIKANDDQWEDYVDALVDEMTDRCADCQLEHEEDIVEKEDIEVDDYEKDTLVEYLNTMASVEDQRDENGIVPYDKISKDKQKDKESDTSEDDASETEDNEVKEEPNRVQDEYLEEDEEDEFTIHYISQEDYEETKNDEFDKIELTYLDGSDVFLTEDKEKYNAYPAIGGRGNLESAFEESPNGIVYIRNDALEIDFRIVSDIRDYDTYMEETSTK